MEQHGVYNLSLQAYISSNSFENVNNIPAARSVLLSYANKRRPDQPKLAHAFIFATRVRIGAGEGLHATHVLTALDS